MKWERISNLMKGMHLKTLVVGCMLLLSISFIIVNMIIIWIKFNYSDMILFIDMVGEETLNSILLASAIIFPSVSYFLYERETRIKRQLFDTIIFWFFLYLTTPFINKQYLLGIVSYNQSALCIYKIVATIFFAYFIWIFGNFLVRLFVNFKNKVTDSNDRITIMIAIIGTILSLIALLK